MLSTVKQARELKYNFYFNGLKLKTTTDPQKFSRRLDKNSKSFLMDIRRRKHCPTNERGEYYIMFLGENNNIDVVCNDPKLKQLVLRVQEPEREFYVENWDHKTKTYKRVLNKTSSDLKYFLLGMDELHLFMCQLNGSPKTISEAHQLLKPEKLRKQSKPKRQGEWFFEKCSRHQAVMLDNQVSLYQRIGPTLNFNYRQNCPIQEQPDNFRRRGRAHVVDELAWVKNSQNTDVYARGKVKHPEHATRSLNTWHRVYGNQEVENTMKGANWID